MTIPSSTIPAVRAALFAGIVSQVNDPTVLVCDGSPGPSQPDDIITVGVTRRPYEIASQVGSGGAGWLREKYTIDVDVEVYRADTDPTTSSTAMSRASALTDSVVAFVRGDPSIGGLVIVAKPEVTTSPGPVWDEDNKGHLVEMTTTFSFYAQL